MAKMGLCILLVGTMIGAVLGQQDHFCLVAPPIGNCRAAIPSFFFNPLTGSCDCFIFGGCGSNGNKFSSLEECMQTCGVDFFNQIPSNDCLQILGNALPFSEQIAPPATQHPITPPTTSSPPITSAPETSPPAIITTASPPTSGTGNPSPDIFFQLQSLFSQLTPDQAGALIQILQQQIRTQQPQTQRPRVQPIRVVPVPGSSIVDITSNSINRFSSRPREFANVVRAEPVLVLTD